MPEVARHRDGLAFKGRNVTRRHFTCDISTIADETIKLSRNLGQVISRYRRATSHANLLWCTTQSAVTRTRHYPLSYRVPVRERYGSTLLPATREQHDQNCTQSH